MNKLPIEQYLKEAFKRNKSAQTHKDVHARAVELIRRCWAENVFIVFTDGLRTNEDQAVLYGKGRKNYYYNGKSYSNPTAKIVTKAKPGTSMHNFGLALDFVTCDGFGKNIDWVVGKDWKRAAAIAKELGFTWGGDWKSFYDAPHIEYSRGFTASQIAAGKWPVFKSFTPIKLTDTNSNKNDEKDDDTMDFTSATTKNAVRDELQQAVDKKSIDESWLDKFDKGTMTNGDYAGLKLIIAQRSVTKK